MSESTDAFVSSARARSSAERELTDDYRDSYGTNLAIGVEHRRDAEVLATTLRRLPDWWPWVRQRATLRGKFAAIDFGAGEAAKSLALYHLLGRELPEVELILHCVEPDPEHAAKIPRDAGVRLHQQTMESFLVDVGAGRIDLDPVPLLGMNLHVAYYLEQRTASELVTIPTLGHCLNVLDPDALLAVIIEGPGDLQDLKWHLHRTRGLGRPAGPADVDATFATLGIPRGRPSIVIPNADWPVGFDGPPGPMFQQLMGFLIGEENYGSRAPEADDYDAAGRWVRHRATARGWDCLWGPDSLTIAGRWLFAHPDDQRYLDRVGAASEQVASDDRQRHVNGRS